MFKHKKQLQYKKPIYQCGCYCIAVLTLEVSISWCVIYINKYIYMCVCVRVMYFLYFLKSPRFQHLCYKSAF